MISTATTIKKRNITLENKLKHDEWIKTQEIVNIPVESIFLKEDIHKNARINFTDQVDKLRSKGVEMLNRPIVVKDEGFNTYSLIEGFRGYIIANALNHKLIPCVVIDKDRRSHARELGYKKRYGWMPVSEISIPKAFREKCVSRAKVDKYLDYYKQHGKLDTPIVIKGKNICVDKYARLVVAKILKLDKVPVIYV